MILCRKNCDATENQLIPYYQKVVKLPLFVTRRKIREKQGIISHETSKIAFVAEFNLFLNGKFKFQATFGQIADADGASMQEDGILDDSET